MHNWFECKVKYDKVDEHTGKDKKVTETYLFDAFSFTEAEARANEEFEKMISSEFLISNLKKVNYSDIFSYDDGDRWFKCKVVLVDMDEKSGKEKKTNNYMLVQADNIKEAIEKLEKELETILVPYEVPSISESPIMDLFPYFENDKQDIPDNLVPLDNVSKNNDNEDEDEVYG